MAIERRVRLYDTPGGLCESMEVHDPAKRDQPGLLYFPNFLGTKEWDFAKAEQIAALGFKVLVVDFYGQGRRPADRAEGQRLLEELTADRLLMRGKLLAHHAQLLQMPGIVPGRAAAVGFCLGGKCVLDLARAGIDLAGVVFHGLYDAPPFANAPMVASLLICHGWNDPMCPPQATRAIAEELTAADVDWQIVAYGGTGHAFTSETTPLDPGRTHGFQPATNRRSWQAMANFLAEAEFGPTPIAIAGNEDGRPDIG